jgi:hypothetical protein
MSVGFALPPLSLLRLGLRYRMRQNGRLPAYKGGVLRGGFGYAFHQATCAQACWGRAAHCEQPVVCPYRHVFETPRPAGIERLHDLQDVPRPFVIDLPPDQRTALRAGDELGFGVTLIGQGIHYFPYFVFGFTRLGELGLGQDRAVAEVEAVLALEPWSDQGTVVYADGAIQAGHFAMQPIAPERIAERAAALPADLRLRLTTPLRLKARGDFLRSFDLPALIRAICWRISALCLFHEGSEWQSDYRPLVELAQTVRVSEVQITWEEWERRSVHRAEAQRMNLGGIVGSVVLHDLPQELRTLLLIGSLIHVGKACVFGHGAYHLEGLESA